MPKAPVKDTELYYVTEGAGYPLLIMHGGLGVDHGALRPWFDPLGDTFEVVYYDHRGNGRSGRTPRETRTHARLADDAAELADYLGHEKVAVLGFSYGGFIALELQEKMKDHRMAATIRSRLAHNYREAGRLDAAEAQYRRTILSWQELGHQTAVANQVECFAYIAASRGNDAHAARLLGAAQAARKRLNEPISYPREVAEYTAVIQQLGETMGAAERDKVIAEGERLSLDEAVLVALKGTRR